MIQLLQGNCLKLLPEIKDKSVDLILCDLPYGTTDCAWDKKLNLKVLWAEYNRIIKDSGAIVLTVCQPFTTELINSNPKHFRYSLVWEKNRAVGFLMAQKRQLRSHEDVLVFYKQLGTYNPQGLIPYGKRVKRNRKKGGVYAKVGTNSYIQKYTNYPKSVLKFDSEQVTVHSTQKPVALMEYLINTYSNPGETVLDNCMGSGTTGVACQNTGRKFIGIEKDEHYFQIAKSRMGLEETNDEVA